jgi:hypothetical protein
MTPFRLHPDPKIFISYNHSDAAFVNNLVEQLKGTGFKIWIDRLELKAGDSIITRIGAAITTSQFVLAVLSPNSIRSRWVQHELEIVSTLEIQGHHIKLIPILYNIKPSERPPFLIQKLYVDFSEHSDSHFADGLQFLIRSIDETRHDSDNITSQTFEKQEDSFLNSVSETPELESDPFISQLKELPLFQLLNKAIILRAFEGRNRIDILGGLAMASNSPQISVANLTALLAFLRDLRGARLSFGSTAFLLSAIADDRSISVDYRWFVVNRIPDEFSIAQSRREKLSLLPNIFRKDRFDPLADRLVAEFFRADPGKNVDSTLSKLWSLDAPHYRSEIVAYIINTSDWTNTPILSPEEVEKISLTNNASILRERFGSSWSGLLGQANKRERIIDLSQDLSHICELENAQIGQVIRLVEAYARTAGASNETTTFFGMNVFSTDNLRKVVERHGEGAGYFLLINVMTSPYIDVMTSILLLTTFGEMYGLESLKYSADMPSALMLKRPNPFNGTDQISAIESLIDIVNEGGDEIDPWILTLLSSSLELFPDPYFLAFTSMKCKSLKHKTEPIRRLLKHISALGRSPRRKREPKST